MVLVLLMLAGVGLLLAAAARQERRLDVELTSAVTTTQSDE